MKNKIPSISCIVIGILGLIIYFIDYANINKLVNTELLCVSLLFIFGGIHIHPKKKIRYKDIKNQTDISYYHKN